ncbi:MAG TPA: hypothetical protein VJ783_19065 [Pirellulales bacterium]|nr:hypothetical protein [Pirellulales bacterium]
MARPEKLRIPYEGPDDCRFDCVGRLQDGTQFMAFVTGAFPTGLKHYLGEDAQFKKRWLAVLHQFDSDGNHIDSESRLGGFDIEGRVVAGAKAFQQLQDMLSEFAAGRQPALCDIHVRLFSIEIDGITHGLFYEQSEEEPDAESGMADSDWVMLEPLDMMFHPPWDSGEYSS